MNPIAQLAPIFLVASVGYEVGYLFGLVMGIFSPAELPWFTVAAVVLAGVFAVHAVRTRHALRDRTHKDHDHLMHDASHMRERRGF